MKYCSASHPIERVSFRRRVCDHDEAEREQQQ
jgi:hypothetical protein